MTDEQNAAVEAPLTVPPPLRQRTASNGQAHVTINDPGDPLTDGIRDDAFRFSAMIANLKESERLANKEVAILRARADELEARIIEMRSELEISNAKREAEIAARLRIEAVLVNVDSLIGSAFAAPK